MDEGVKNQKDSKKDKGKGLSQAKTEKLAGATYVVTSFLSDNDPLKWRLREQALNLISLATPRNPEPFLAALDSLISFLDIALLGAQVSPMNLNILKQEYQSLGQAMASSSELILPELSREAPIELAELKETVIPSPSAPAKGQTYLTAITTPASKTQTGSPRQDQILRFLRIHGESSIKDISQAVAGVSSKTIQRELSQLVNQGVLERKGDRRWSRYKLTSPSF